MNFQIEIKETHPGYFQFSLKQSGKRKPVLSGADMSIPRIMASITVQVEAAMEAAYADVSRK